jgi:hypothetical protein
MPGLFTGARIAHGWAMMARSLSPFAVARRAPMLAALLLPAALLAGCVPEGTPPPAALAPPPPRPAPPPPPPPPPVAWEDAPLTPGDWTYAGGVARFGLAGQAAPFTLACDRAARSVTLVRLAPAAAVTQGAMDVTTSFGKRRLPATADGKGGLAARLTAADGLLDWMAFSRGRIRIETTGQPPLTLPSWAEIGRVVEDCRK